MEYRIILSGTVTKECIEKVAKNWLLVDPLRFLRQPGVSTNNGFGAGNRVGFDDPYQRSNYSAFPRAGQVLPPVWGKAPPRPGSRRPFGPPAPTHPVGPGNNHLRDYEQCNVGEFHIAPQIKLFQLSEMGKRQVHTFVLNDREVLVVQMAGMHATWIRLKQSWESTHYAQTAQTVGSTVDQTQWGRLERAMESGIRQLPSEAMSSLRAMIKTLFTWEGFLLVAAVTALFILGGEVALLLMGAIAVYDILMNVLPLLVQFYNTAIKATTEEQIEAAGALFAQAILRGALDVVDILFAAGAYRRLLVLGGGRLTFRAVMVYLVERVQVLIRRMAEAAERLKQLTTQVQAEIERRIALHKRMKNRQSGGTNSSSEIAKDGYRTRAEGVQPNTRSVRNTKITSSGIAKIRKHLSREQFMEEGELAANNKVMIERMEKIERGELEPTLKDKNFYEHELREQELMDKGMTYDDAHAQTCKEYGITVAEEKANAFYTDEAMKAWDAQIKKNLGF